MGRRHSHVRASLHLTAALVWFGCEHPSQPDPGSILLSSEEPICVGTLPALREEGQRLADEIGLEWLFPVEVEIATHDRLLSLCANACEADTCSCAPGFGPEARVYAWAGAVPHELVHVLRRQHGIRGTPFVEEGVAQALGGGFFGGRYGIGVDPADWPSGPTQLFHVDSRELVEADAGYLIAGHFYDYLAETVGESSVLDAISNDAYRDASTPAEFESWFADAFGMTLEQADAGWRERGYRGFWRGASCAVGLDFDLVLGSVLSFSQVGDCDDSEDTLGPYESTGGSLSTRLHPWCVTTSAGGLAVRGDASRDTTLRFEPLECDPTSESPGDEAFTVEVGPEVVRDIAACTWVISAGSTAETFSYSVELALR